MRYMEHADTSHSFIGTSTLGIPALMRLLRRRRGPAIPVTTEAVLSNKGCCEPDIYFLIEDSLKLSWTTKQRDACVNQGCHQSANLHSNFLREEMATFMEDKFWVVLPYELVRELAELMLPAAVKGGA